MSRRGFLALAALVAAVPAFAQLRAITYVTGLNNPMYMVQDPTRPDTQYVLQRSGEIKVVVNGAIQATDYLNLTSLTTTDGERGLLSMALASDFATSGYAYIEYTDTSGNIEIKRYTRSTSNPLTLDPSTVHNVITIPHSMYDFHNGGTIAFGSDGYLYCGVGDGGPEYDPNNNAQNPNLLLGKMIRIDPSSDDFPSDDTKNYAIPPTNPFANGSGPVSALPEIWAFGYRNPFRYSFDSPGLGGNGGLVVGDVGQDAWEEVDYEPAAHGGRNYGWKQREGLHDSGLGGTSAYTPLTDPIYNCPHNGQSSAIIGGYVYRGAGLGPAFQGRYFFADDEQGKVWSMALSYDANGEATGSDIQDHTSELGTSAIGNPSAFGEDSNGDLYVINLTGGSISMIASTTMTITGHVTLQQWLGPVAGQQITIGVRRPGSTTNLDTYTTTLDALGDFSVTTNRIGHYDVAIKASHWLRKVDHGVSFGSGGAGGISVSVENGDIDGDNTVSLADFGALKLAYGSTVLSANWNPNADLNGDGVVSLADFGILKQNYRHSGDS